MSKRDQIFDAFSKGYSNQQIADEFDINIRTVYHYRSAYKNMILSLTSKVSKQVDADAALEDVLSEFPNADQFRANIKDEIFDDFDNGYTPQQVATKYNLSYSTVNYYYSSYRTMMKALDVKGVNLPTANQIEGISDVSKGTETKGHFVSTSYGNTSITRDGDTYYFVFAGARFSSTEEEFDRLVNFFNAMKEMK